MGYRALREALVLEYIYYAHLSASRVNREEGEGNKTTPWEIRPILMEKVGESNFIVVVLSDINLVEGDVAARCILGAAYKATAEIFNQIKETLNLLPWERFSEHIYMMQRPILRQMAALADFELRVPEKPPRSFVKYPKSGG